MNSYLIITETAPELPSTKISYHFAQRWIPHYFVGTLAKALGLEIELTYTLTNGLIILLIVIWTKRLLISNDQPNGIEYLMLMLFLCSAYTFRLYVFVPGLFADLVYILGVVIALNGCRSVKGYQIMIGMIIATTGKQLSLLILPGMVIYAGLMFTRTQGRKAAFSFCFLLITVVFLTYGLLIVTSNSFSHANSITIDVLFAIVPWLLSENFEWSLMGEHLLRIMLPLAPMLTIWAMFPEPLNNKLRRLISWESLGLVLIMLGPIAYAFLPGPLVQMGNQSRYVVGSMLPLALLIILVTPRLAVALKPSDWLCLSATLALLSYHHRYTSLQSQSTLFVATQALALGLIIVWGAFRLKHLILKREFIKCKNN